MPTAPSPTSSPRKRTLWTALSRMLRRQTVALLLTVRALLTRWPATFADRTARPWVALICLLPALSLLGGCAKPPIVRTEVVEVRVPVVIRPPDRLLRDCAPTWRLGDSFSVLDGLTYGDELGSTLRACNDQLAALRKFFDQPLPDSP